MGNASTDEGSVQEVRDQDEAERNSSLVVGFKCKQDKEHADFMQGVY